MPRMPAHPDQRVPMDVACRERAARTFHVRDAGQSHLPVDQRPVSGGSVPP